MQKGNFRRPGWVTNERRCAADTEESLRLSAVCLGRQQQWDYDTKIALNGIHLHCKRDDMFQFFSFFSRFHAESGQTSAQTSGCLDVLLDLFRYFSVRIPLAHAELECPHQLVFLAGLLIPCPQSLLVGVLTLARSTNSGHQCPALSVGASTTLKMVLSSLNVNIWIYSCINL